MCDHNHARVNVGPSPVSTDLRRLAKRAGWDKSTSGSKALDDDYRQLLRLLAESALVDTTVSDHTVSVATAVLRGKMPAEGVCCGNLQEPCWLANAMVGVCAISLYPFTPGVGWKLGLPRGGRESRGRKVAGSWSDTVILCCLVISFPWPSH